MKPRELYNLFREVGGYQYANLRANNHGVSAFVAFADNESAQRAKARFDGEVFDPDAPETRLRIEMAKQNSRKRASDYSVGHKRPAAWDASANMGYTAPAPDYAAAQSDPTAFGGGYNITADPAGAYPQFQGYQGYGAYGAVGYGAPQQPQQQPQRSSRSGAGNPPCSTLFLANMSTRCTEAELTEFMQFFQGFTKLKFTMKGNGALAFVDFTDEPAATQALQGIQGYVLPSNDPSMGGVRGEYAKARMGKQ